MTARSNGKVMSKQMNGLRDYLGGILCFFSLKKYYIIFFQFTKKIINQYRDNVEGDILDYIDLPVDKVCELFSNKFTK